MALHTTNSLQSAPQLLTPDKEGDLYCGRKGPWITRFFHGRVSDLDFGGARSEYLPVGQPLERSVSKLIVELGLRRQKINWGALVLLFIVLLKHNDSAIILARTNLYYSSYISGCWHIISFSGINNTSSNMYFFKCITCFVPSIIAVTVFLWTDNNHNS